MRPSSLLAAVGALAIATAAPALHAATTQRAVRVEVTVTTGEPGARTTRSFTLGCNPPGGTLPLAASICDAIVRHPKAMLNPPRPGPSRARIACSGSPAMPVVVVHATRNGVARTFSGSPGCDWPGNQAIAVYYDAAARKASILRRDESELRCDEDPVLLATPTPLASVNACRHGLWTAHAEALIRLAATAPALAALDAAHFFPRDIGALPCTIHAGGPYPGRRLPALCGVTLRHAWGTATVSFTESWSAAPGRTNRHTWHVVIRRGRVIATTDAGTPPPQLWA